MTSDTSNVMRLARVSDPETSFDAADMADLYGSQQKVLSLLRDFGPMTDARLQELYAIDVKVSPGHRKMLYSGERLRTARKELERQGMVEWTGDKETLPSGRMARIWKAKEWN